MPQGKSGRIVIEIDRELKRRLYSSLASRGLTLKDWFIVTAGEFIQAEKQPTLFDGDNEKKGKEQR